MKKILTIFSNNAPSPHVFNSLPLKSTTVELTEITMKINELLPQLSDFIDQFNSIVLSTKINVITDTSGNMSMDVPNSMPDNEAEMISKRIGIIDRLITTRGQEVNNLLLKGLEIESKLKEQNPNYTSQILDKVNELKRLNDSYRH